MKHTNNILNIFLALVRSGLWEREAQLSHHDNIDFEEILCLAEKQSVVGLVTAGLEHATNIKVSQEELLQFIGQSIQIEQRNKAMNTFLSGLVEKMRQADIYTILVKGQGVAQCYERPLWRASGDVDFLFSDSNYKKAKAFLLPLSSGNKNEERYSQHLGMNIDSWYVEIHGSLRTGLSGRVDKVIDAVQKDVFYGGNVRSWNNCGTTVFLPAPANDVFFIFTHFIKHFYKEGMNLRQICDWCRLLWDYRDSLDQGLLESRIRKAGLMDEWKVFAALAVEYLGMPKEAMPLYDASKRWNKKAKRILNFIVLDYNHQVVRDTLKIAIIFPLSSLKFSPAIFFNVNGLKIKERLFK